MQPTSPSKLSERILGEMTELTEKDVGQQPHLSQDDEEHLIDFDGPKDGLHPHNWPFKRKLLIGVAVSFFTLTAAFGSSIFSPAIIPVAKQFEVSTTVSTLGVSLYVLGFATGPILWAPWSEISGRQQPLLAASLAFSVFNLGVGVVKNLPMVLICRFWAGFFGACPLAVGGAVMTDMFDHRTRGAAVTVFSIAVFSGPMFAPSIGGFIVMSSLGWAWTSYLVAIMGLVSFLLLLVTFQETYAPSILVHKAKSLRQLTKNWSLHAKQEELDTAPQELLEKNFTRPLRMLFTEPIVFLVSLYMAFIYGLLYLFLTAYPIVFQQIHGMNPGVGGIPFLGIIFGEVLAGTLILLNQPRYLKKLIANHGIPVPEWRLPETIAGGIIFACGLFVFGWTGYKRSIHWIAPSISGVFSGFGILSIFLQSLNYLVDVYLMYAASAMAASTILRSLFAAAFPLFAPYLFRDLGVQWASTLLGCVAALLIPVPVWFFLCGPTIRKRSAFTPQIPSSS